MSDDNKYITGASHIPNIIPTVPKPEYFNEMPDG